MKRFEVKRLVVLAGYALFCVCLLALVFQVYRLARVELNSDDASEMILSRILAQEGGILSDNWYYSTEIRVFHMQVIWAALFRLFGLQADWLLVRVAGTLVGYAILFASLFLLCWRMRATRFFPFLAALWAVPFCDDQYNFVQRSPFYLPFIVLELFLLTIAVSYEQCPKRNGKILLGVCSMLLSVLTGLCGIRMLVVYHLPTVLAVAILAWSERAAWKRWIPLAGLVSGNLVSAGVGYLLYSKVLAARYPVTQHFAWFKYTGFSFDRLEEAINTFIAHLGFRTGNLYSTDLVANACCAALILLTAYSVRAILTDREVYSPIDRFLAASYLGGLLLLTVLVSFTNMQFLGRYWLPITSFTFPVIFLCFGKREAGKKKNENLAALALCVSCVLLPGAIWHYTQLMRPLDIERSVIQQTLVEQGYTDGFATFWNSNILTELSDGEIEVWTIEGPDSVEKLYQWLQKRTHDTEKPEGKVFLLLSSDEKEQCPIIEDLSEENVIYSSDGYVAYGFDSYTELVDMYDRAQTAA